MQEIDPPIGTTEDHAAGENPSGEPCPNQANIESDRQQIPTKTEQSQPRADSARADEGEGRKQQHVEGHRPRRDPLPVVVAIMITLQSLFVGLQLYSMRLSNELTRDSNRTTKAALEFTRESAAASEEKQARREAEARTYNANVLDQMIVSNEATRVSNTLTAEGVRVARESLERTQRAWLAVVGADLVGDLNSDPITVRLRFRNVGAGPLERLDFALRLSMRDLPERLATTDHPITTRLGPHQEVTHTWKAGKFSPELVADALSGKRPLRLLIEATYGDQFVDRRPAESVCFRYYPEEKKFGYCREGAAD